MQLQPAVRERLIAFDPQPPAKASGIRLGTPAVTTRGMKEPEMERIAELIDRALSNRSEPEALETIRREVAAFVDRFPLYPELQREVKGARCEV